MKLACFIVVATLLAGVAGCRHSASSPPRELSAFDQMPPEIQNAYRSLARAETLFEQNKLTEAQEQIAPLIRDGLLTAEVTELAAKINARRAEVAVERGQNEMKSVILGEVEKRLMLPATYGKTVVISHDLPNHAIPAGPMEEMLTRNVSMHLEDAGIKELVMALSKLDSLNIIADEALAETKRLTVKLNDIPLRELLSYVSRNMGIDFQIGQNTIWVTSGSGNNAGNANMETRIFRLSRGFIPTLGANDKKTTAPDDTELEDALNSFFVSVPAGPLYRVYRNRNLLIVRDTHQKLRQLEDVLNVLDREPLQVLIEAQFITISESDLLRIGLSLQDIIIPKAGGTATFNSLSQRITSTTTKKDGSVVVETPEAIDDALAGRRLQASGNLPGQLFLSGILGNTTYQAVLDALKQVSSSRTLSAPRVTVANNHTAYIHRGEIRYYFQQYALQSIDLGDLGTRTQLVPSGTPSELLLGYELTAKVNIGNDGRTVMLALRPDVKEFIDWEQIFGEDIRLPRVAENTVSTTVVVESGETVVLGGTLLKTQTESIRKVPYLSDIPYIGALFRTKETTEQPLHLLIFVTATVINKSGEFVNYQNSAEN